MRIGIDTRALLLPITGIGRYTQQIIKHLHEIKKPSDEIIYFWGSGYEETTEMIDDIGKSKHTHHVGKQGVQGLWEQVVLPVRIHKHKLDVYHSPRNYNIPYMKLNKIPIVVTMHDIIPILFPEEYRFSKIAKYRYIFTVNRADHIITISSHSKKDIVNYFNINKDKIDVIYNAVDDRFFVSNLDAEDLKRVKNKYGIDKPYLLTTGGTEPIKNGKMLIDVYQQGLKKYPEIFNNIELVIVGPEWPGRDVPDSVEDNIKFTGYVAEKDIPILFAGAEIFLFPSLYEGFGLPPLEALAAGTPVISSNASSLPEVVGDAGILLNPEDVSGWTETIVRLLNNPDKMNSYTEKGLKRASKFSWKRTAEELYSLYERLTYQ